MLKTIVFRKKTFSEMLKVGLPDEVKELPIQKTLLTKQGKGLMVFPDKTSRDLAAEALKKDCEVQVQENKLLLPKIKICGISKEFINKENMESIKQEILLKNQKIRDIVKYDEESLKLLFTVDEKDEGYFSVVLKVDPKIKEAIECSNNRVFIGFSACKVYERFHILQCYKCQGFGHKHGSDKCFLKDSDKCICLYCGENHPSKECLTKKSENENYKKFKCFNCSVCHDEDIRKNCTGHTSNSYQCPMLQKELKRLLTRTMGSKNHKDISKNSVVT